MKNLQLSLKGKWFEMTEPNGKTEDYRDINPYWAARLFNKHDKSMTIWFWEGYLGMHGVEGNRHFYYYGFRNQESIDYVIKSIGFKDFATNIMTLGYPKSTDTSRIKIFEHKGIEIGYGKEEWGAEPNKLYFIIKHGKRLQ